MSNKDILTKLAELGIDLPRMESVLAPRADNWGDLVHAFEVLTVLGVVADAMKAQARLVEAEQIPGQMAITDEDWIDRRTRLVKEGKVRHDATKAEVMAITDEEKP